MANHEWEVVGKDNHVVEGLACAAVTGGLSLLFGGCTPTYTVRDEEGNEKKVSARNSKDMGEKISKGKFD